MEKIDKQYKPLKDMITKSIKENQTLTNMGL